MQRGNENIRERLGYSRVNPSHISYDELEAHRMKTLESMMKNYGDNPIRWTRDKKVLDELDRLAPGKQGNLPFPKKDPNELGNVSTDIPRKWININNFSVPWKIELDSPIPSTGKKIFYPSKKLLKSKNRNMLDAFLERHELYEAQAAEKAIQKSIQSRMHGKPKAAKSFIKHPGSLKSSHTGKEYTGHTDLNVLVKERRDLDTFTHTNNPAYRFVRKVREAVERPYMDAASGFNPAKAVQPHKPIDMFKNHEREFLRNVKKPVHVGNDLIQSVK